MDPVTPSGGTPAVPTGGTPTGGTPRELLPITEKVLAWVARVRKTGGVDLGDLRRIELCALATREACYFHDLYGSWEGWHPGRSGRIVHRDSGDDSGFYLPPDDRETVGDALAPMREAAEARSVLHPCARCGEPTTRYTMGTADDRPTYVCDLWPDCSQET